jgi:hypothetical protein
MPDQTARDVANLKLQFDALQKSVQTVSLPEALAKMRSTLKWAAVVVAIALVASSLIRMFSDTEIRDLRQRVETLEKM